MCKLTALSCYVVVSDVSSDCSHTTYVSVSGREWQTTLNGRAVTLVEIPGGIVRKHVLSGHEIAVEDAVQG